ncbi:MAG: HAD family hydrolase [Rhodobacterales bacterium]|nr:MAG: HAD family hydrolase [Rhodobacterales bacterium]
MNHDLTLVVFDIDGTLVDSQGMILDGFTRAFAAIGRERPAPARLLAQVGLSLPEVMARLLPEADAETRARAAGAYRTYALGLKAAPLFDGAAALIARLAACDDVLIGAATGMSRRGLDQLLDAHGLARHFVTRQTADAHPSKPHPAMLEAALAETGVAPGRAVMVGDTTYDIEMAGHAGVRGIGVSWGHHPRDALMAAGAGAVVDSFTALAAEIDAIRGAAP